ncbi:MAG: hypothetical protein ABSB86_07330 [Bryobacteraceae bacterium]|jgi:hypothetical protein
MRFAATPYTVTTALLVAFAVFVLFIRLKGWIDSNVPLIFYVATLAYMHAIEGAVPVWLILAGFALTLMLRFEFMNPTFVRAVRFLEIGVLVVLVYLGLTMLV